MSRAFVDEDASSEPEPRYTLPDPDSPHFDRAAALALIEGANLGNTRSAELATGFRWGEPRLRCHVEALLAEASERDEVRIVQLARRFLRKAEDYEAIDEAGG
ncbi:MAG: hypothetical protein OEM23_06360 [Gemmatimonadota bacterium]|nr:hypothetical protein [Gemmatimonadota bacterium]